MPAVSWTDPTTFVDGVALTAAQLNEMGDDLLFLKGTDRAMAYSNASQSVSNTSWTHILLAAEEYDTNGLHDNSTNNWRITIATDGLYVIAAAVEWDGSSALAARRTIQVRKNDSTTNATAGSRLSAVTSLDASGTIPVPMQTFTIRYLAAGDYISLHAWQNTGSAINVDPGSDSTWLSAAWIGD